MSPDPREIAAVLAAPEPVREALRRCEGPGWVFTWVPTINYAPSVSVALELCGGPGAEPAQERPFRPWLPVDPTAIVVEAARVVGWRRGWVLETWNDGYRAGSPHGYHRDGETPRLAAIALLTAVLGASRG